MPLVIFGDEMFHRGGIKFKCHQHGVNSIIYKNLKRREKVGELCLLHTNEFRASALNIYPLVVM